MVASAEPSSTVIEQVRSVMQRLVFERLWREHGGEVHGLGVKFALEGQPVVVEPDPGTPWNRARPAEAAPLQAHVEFSRPLVPGSLLVRRLTDDDYYAFFGDPELTFGDEAFDEVLLVRGDPAHRAKAFLTAPRRWSLLALLATSETLTLTEVDLIVTGRHDVDSASSWVNALGRVLSEFGGPSKSAGPYR